MKLHRLETSPPEWLGIALEEFEQQFSYPLGQGASFHVVHGRQYVSFFQAMGEAIVFVAERDGRVLGTIAVIRRRLNKPDGGEAPAYYVCDLKVTHTPSGGLVLAGLMHAVRDHVLRTGLAPVYGVVMDGTSRIPMQYTGRMDIPLFEPMAEIAVLKISAGACESHAMACERVACDAIETVCAPLRQGAWWTSYGVFGLRSEMKPAPLVMSHDRACGVVEDTRLGKRLALSDGTEMRSAHLSSFGFVDAASGLALIQSACAVALQQGFPSMFVSVPKTERCEELIKTLVSEFRALEASATVYGTGFPKEDKAEWWLNTSEI